MVFQNLVVFTKTSLVSNPALAQAAQLSGKLAGVKRHCGKGSGMLLYVQRAEVILCQLLIFGGDHSSSPDKLLVAIG